MRMTAAYLKIAGYVVETDRFIHKLEIAVQARGVWRQAPGSQQPSQGVNEADLLRRQVAA